MLSQQDAGLGEDGRMYGGESAIWRDARDLFVSRHCRRYRIVILCLLVSYTV